MEQDGAGTSEAASLQTGLPGTCCAPRLLSLKRVLQYRKFTVTFWTPGPIDNITPFFFLPAATLRHFKDPGSAQRTPVTVSASWERPCCLPQSPVGRLSPPSTRDCSSVLTASRPGPRNERLSNLHSRLYSMCCPQWNDPSSNSVSLVALGVP